MTAVLDRFLNKVEPQWHGGCWAWTAGQNGLGYGRFYDGKLTYAHRWSYEHFVGPIAEGLDLDHLCHNPSCVNPAHLEPVTHQENIARGMARKTHCPHGHEYTEANTYVYKGARFCRTCNNAQSRRRQRKRRAA